MYSSIRNTQINVYNFQMCTCTLTMLQIYKFPNLEHQPMLQTYTNAPPTQSTQRFLRILQILKI